MSIEKPKPQTDPPDPERSTCYPSQQQHADSISINGTGNQVIFQQNLFLDGLSRRSAIAPAQHIELTDEQREHGERDRIAVGKSHDFRFAARGLLD